ncbi:MAG: hypothetical protein HXK83_03515 [Lachnospiraceae bacterium]|nr:hypothetical protein [Lachnospiraceae bacterium]
MTFLVGKDHTTIPAACVNTEIQLLAFGNNDDKGHTWLIRHSEPQLQRCFFSCRSDLGFLYYYELNKAMIQRELAHRNLKFHPLCQATPHAYLGKKHRLARQESIRGHPGTLKIIPEGEGRKR